MQLRFSHVDIVVKDLVAASDYYRRIFGCQASPKQVWHRGDFHVEYVIMFAGDERFFLVQPISGDLKKLIDEKGEGTIYRLCYTVPDIAEAFAELKAQGVQPENERGEPMTESDLESPSGTRIIWLPKAFGGLSIELLEEHTYLARMNEIRQSAT